MSTPLLQVRRHRLTTKCGEGPGAFTAVKDVSFDVEPDETVAIARESGSGKSMAALSRVGLVPIRPAASPAVSIAST